LRKDSIPFFLACDRSLHKDFCHRIAGEFFWPHDMSPDFSPCPIVNAINFFLPMVLIVRDYWFIESLFWSLPDTFLLFHEWPRLWFFSLLFCFCAWLWFRSLDCGRCQAFPQRVFCHCWCGSSFKKPYPAEKSGEHAQTVGAQQPDARMKSSTRRLVFHVLPIAIPLGHHPLEAPDRRVQRLSFSGFLSPPLSNRRTILSFRDAIFARHINFAIS
jgi:hypothetical protein